MKQSSAGPMFLIVDTKQAAEGILVLKNLNSITIGFQVQVYGETKFNLGPSKGLVGPKQAMNIEATGGRAEVQNFHVVALGWPNNQNTFQDDVWKKLERRDKDKRQVITFGNPPQYTGIRQFGQERSSRETATLNTGPKLLNAHMDTISFKPRTGKVQTATVKLKNVNNKATAFKILTNRGPFYTVKPSRGILDITKDVKFDVEMNDSYTKKEWDIDQKGHEIHILGIRWPKPINEYHHDEWKRLEKARSDNKQRIVLSINHKGEANAPPEGETKSVEQLTRGPTLIEVSPKKLVLGSNLGKSHTLTLRNTTFTSCVAFKLQTNKPKFYVVNPTKGLIKAEDKKVVKIEINEALKAKDFQDAEQHRFLLVAVEWRGKEDQFDNDLFTARQKVAGKDNIQRLCLEAELESASKQTYLAAFPPVLSFFYKPGDDWEGVSQVIKVTLANKIDKGVAFKIEPSEDFLKKCITVEPTKGVIQSTQGTPVTFTLKANADEKVLKDPGSYYYRLQAIKWHIPTFDENLWTEYQGFKKDDFQTMNIRMDTEAKEVPGGDESGLNVNQEAMMMAMMMQMQGMGLGN